MNGQMGERIIYLNKDARRKNMLFELLLILGFVVLAFVLYFFVPQINMLLVLGPLSFLLVLRIYLYLKDSKALVLHKGKLYACRSGFVAKKEVEDAYIAEKRGLFKNQKCLFFDLETGGLYEPTVFADWSLYALPTTIIALCESDVDMPLEQVLEIVKEYKR